MLTIQPTARDSTVVYPGPGDDTTLGAERPHLADWKQRGWLTLPLPIRGRHLTSGDTILAWTTHAVGHAALR